jgi:hypothetical protein
MISCKIQVLWQLRYKVDMETEKDEKQDELDWESRQLCSDESCIGVIGPDGRCNECGMPFKDK